MSKYYGTMQAMRGAPNIVPNTDYTVWANKYLAVKNYKETAIDLLQLAFPSLTQTELEYAVDRSIAEHMQWHEATIDNSYKKVKIKTTLPYRETSRTRPAKHMPGNSLTYPGVMPPTY